MKKAYCQDCGIELVVKSTKISKRCRQCHLINIKSKRIAKCIDCGKDIDKYVHSKRCRFCFIKSHSTKFKESDYDDAFANWLCGFTDGEGNFSMVKNHGQSFRINLREDDKPILEEIRNRLGCGVLHFLRKTKYNPNQRDQWQFTVATLVDLVNIIIPLFDKYLLRAKKKNDYYKWRNLLLGQWEKLQGGNGR